MTRMTRMGEPVCVPNKPHSFEVHFEVLSKASPVETFPVSDLERSRLQTTRERSHAALQNTVDILSLDAATSRAPRSALAGRRARRRPASAQSALPCRRRLVNRWKKHKESTLFLGPCLVFTHTHTQDQNQIYCTRGETPDTIHFRKRGWKHCRGGGPSEALMTTGKPMRSACRNADSAVVTWSCAIFVHLLTTTVYVSESRLKRSRVPTFEARSTRLFQNTQRLSKASRLVSTKRPKPTRIANQRPKVGRRHQFNRKIRSALERAREARERRSVWTFEEQSDAEVEPRSLLSRRIGLSPKHPKRRFKSGRARSLSRARRARPEPRSLWRGPPCTRHRSTPAPQPQEAIGVSVSYQRPFQAPCSDDRSSQRRSAPSRGESRTRSRGESTTLKDRPQPYTVSTDLKHQRNYKFGSRSKARQGTPADCATMVEPIVSPRARIAEPAGPTNAIWPARRGF